MYISLHSFGQKVLYPWSYTKKRVRDWADLELMANVWTKAIFEASNGRYKYKVEIIYNIYFNILL